jgi:hypothetical protein
MRTTVRLPSDNLTRKQRKELNGMAVTYSMNEPHTYYELLAFPKDLRKQYIEGLIEKYHPSTNDMKKMLKCSEDSYKALKEQLEIKHPRYYRSYEEKAKWDEFLGVEPKKAETPKKEESKKVNLPSFWDNYPGIGKVDHISLHVTGKPLAVANGLPMILDANKEYYFSINIVERQDVPVPEIMEEVPNFESDLCGAEEIC